MKIITKKNVILPADFDDLCLFEMLNQALSSSNITWKIGNTRYSNFKLEFIYPQNDLWELTCEVEDET